MVPQIAASPPPPKEVHHSPLTHLSSPISPTSHSFTPTRSSCFTHINSSHTFLSPLPSLHFINLSLFLSQPIRPKGDRIGADEIQVVQNHIEKCLQLYMNQNEVITALVSQANIEPGFTSLGTPLSLFFPLSPLPFPFHLSSHSLAMNCPFVSQAKIEPGFTSVGTSLFLPLLSPLFRLPSLSLLPSLRKGNLMQKLGGLLVYISFSLLSPPYRVVSGDIRSFYSSNMSLSPPSLPLLFSSPFALLSSYPIYLLASTVWQRLEEQNPDFFRGYHVRLRVKEQITAFNYLATQQYQGMHSSPSPHPSSSHLTSPPFSPSPHLAPFRFLP